MVTKVRDAAGGETSFVYDENGNLRSLTDARGKTTAYGYDEMDRITSRTDPLQRAESYAYDENGNLVRHIDREGIVTRLSYDPLDRLIFTGFSETGSPEAPSYESTIDYSHDKGDRLTQAADSAAGTIALVYDTLDRLTLETTHAGSVAYDYDPAGRRTSMNVSGEPAVGYAYDAGDNLTQVTKGPQTVALTYDDASRRTSLTLPNGMIAVYGYDAASRLTSIAYSRSGTVLGELSYGYDAGGSRTRLSGSFARQSLPDPVSQAAYDDANRLTSWNGESLGYDHNGNLIQHGSAGYTWNARGELASISGAGTLASFRYDAFGRRVEKTVNTQTTGYRYDGEQAVQELAGSPLVPAVNLLTGVGLDEVFSRTELGGTHSLLADALGSTLALADGSGAVQTEYTYEPFGKTRQTGVASGSSIQFTGRENDSTDLYYHRARYYSPAQQRFISEDPLEFGGDEPNLYTYAMNRPTVLTDPTGLCALSLFHVDVVGVPFGRKSLPAHLCGHFLDLLRFIGDGNVTVSWCYGACFGIAIDRSGVYFYGLCCGTRPGPPAITWSPGPISADPQFSYGGCYGVCLGATHPESGGSPTPVIGVGPPGIWGGPVRYAPIIPF